MSRRASHRIFRGNALFGLAGLYLLLSVVAGIVLAEALLHLHRLPVSGGAAFRTRIKAKYGADVQEVAIPAADGALLKAWFVIPRKPNGQSVIVLHGVTGNRVGSAGFAEMFLDHGYAVLLPDSREHGESGGAIATYGVLERKDVARWTAWARQREPGCTYVLGESMGAAIALQATEVTPQLCAVAVESPYSTFWQIGFERLGRGSHTGTLFWRSAGLPVMVSAVLYARLRYGIWLPDASPREAIEHSRVPALLIAGTADRTIPMHHAQELQQACSTRCSLWIVPDADHGGASSVAHAEFEQRVVGWFASHGEPAQASGSR